MSDPSRPKTVPSSESDQDSSTSSPEVDQQPMRVGHGRRIMNKLGDTRRDVVTTISNTQAIIDLLTPDEEETNPILDALEQVILAQRHQQGTLEDILKQLRAVGERLAQLERRQQ